MSIICQKSMSIGFPLVFQTLQWAKCVISQQTLRCQLLRGKRRKNSQFNDLPKSQLPFLSIEIVDFSTCSSMGFWWEKSWRIPLYIDRNGTCGYEPMDTNFFPIQKLQAVWDFLEKQHPSRHLLQLFIIIHIFGQITSATGTHMAVPCDIFVAKRRYSFLIQTDFCT